MRNHTGMTVLLLMLLLVQNSLFATINLTEEERSYIASRSPVVAASVDGSGPIQYSDSQGRIRGISILVMDEIARRTGLVFDYRLYEELIQAKQAYTDGSTDILFGVPDQYGDSSLKQSRPFLHSQTIFFANTSIKAKELSGKRFAATVSSPLPEGVSEGQAIYYQSREKAITAVDEGEADFGYGNAYSLAFYTLQNGYRNIYTIPQGKEERLYRIRFLQEDPLLVSIIDKAIASFSEMELQNLVLEATSQVERTITASMILDTYGQEISLISFIIITILIAFLAFIQKSRVSLALEKKKFRTIAEVSNEYLFEYDTHHRTLVLYEKFKALFTTASSLEAAQAKLVTYLSTPPPAEENPVIELQISDDTRFFFRISSRKVRGKYASNSTLIGKLQDITGERERQNHLENLAKTDGLTGLLNADTTRSLIGQRLQQRDSSKTDYCILFDIDDFKTINDSKGHLEGDRVLKDLGTLLVQGSHSEKDIIGRVGGDEFCIYLVAILTEEEALDYCNFLLESVRFTFRSEGVTISMGITKVENTDTYETLYARVDRMMYQAKSKGKNRVKVFSSQAGD